MRTPTQIPTARPFPPQIGVQVPCAAAAGGAQLGVTIASLAPGSTLAAPGTIAALQRIGNRKPRGPRMTARVGVRRAFRRR
jgi:hypothetical protein